MVLAEGCFARQHKRHAIDARLFRYGIIPQLIARLARQRGGHVLDRVFNGIEPRFTRHIGACVIVDIFTHGLVK